MSDHLDPDTSAPRPGARAARSSGRIDWFGRLAIAAIVAVLVTVTLTHLVGDRADAQTSQVQRLDAPAVGLERAERGSMRRVLPTPPAGKLPFPVDGSQGCTLWRQSFGRVPSSSPTGKHEGTDIMGVDYRQVYAVEPGVLYRRYTGTGTSGSGHGWALRGDSGVIYKYFHLTTDSAGWRVNDRVEIGHVIGYVGDTGTIPGNHHLHFEVRPGDVPVDPLPLLDVPATCRIF